MGFFPAPRSAVSNATHKAPLESGEWHANVRRFLMRGRLHEKVDGAAVRLKTLFGRPVRAAQGT